MASEIKVDTISEKTSANGVTIDGVNIKDSALATAGSVPLSTIDIDGGTDIGAAIVDADLFIIDDGAGGTNRKVAASRIKTYAGGAVTAINNATANELVTIGSTTTELDAESGLTYTDGSLTIKGTTPTLTIGDAGAEDTKIVFDGNAVDYWIGLDDSEDKLVLGTGSTVNTSSQAITVDSSGHVLKPLQSAFLGTVGVVSNVTGDSTTYTYIPSEVVDRNGDFSTSTFTAPVTGLYHCYVQHNLNGLTSSTTGGISRINTSNRTYYWNMNPYAISNAGTTVGLSHSVIADLDASDTLTFAVDIDGGSKVVDTEDTTIMGVFLLG